MDHRIERARERYGLELTPEAVRSMEAEIRSGTGVWFRMKRGIGGSEIGCLRRPEGLLVAVWRPGPDGGHIATFLPADVFAAGPAARRRRRSKWS